MTRTRAPLPAHQPPRQQEGRIRPAWGKLRPVMLLARFSRVAFRPAAGFARCRSSGVPVRALSSSAAGRSSSSSSMDKLEKITFGKDLPGYVCGSVKDPAVIVIQEWWGVVPTIADHALKISEQGYRCLIPDLYKGSVGVDKEEASHLLSKLDWVAAVDEIKQAVEYLRADGANKVGAIGFCMGGALTLAAAQHAGVDCAAPFYGLPGPEICQPEAIKVPLLMNFGELDNMKGFSDPESAKAFADKVNAAGGKAELVVYPACGHGFLNVGEEAVAKRDHMGFPEPPKEQQEAAWVNVFRLFDQQLKGK